MSTLQTNESENKSLLKINDNIDFLSILFVLLSNLNVLISVFFVSLFLSSIYYLTTTKIYNSISLLEIQNDSGMDPNNLINPLQQFSKNPLRLN